MCNTDEGYRALSLTMTERNGFYKNVPKFVVSKELQTRVLGSESLFDVFLSCIDDANVRNCTLELYKTEIRP